MAVITSAATGLWSATTTWTGGVVPIVGDKLTISAGHVVTVDGIYTTGDDTTTGITIDGTLKASRTVTNSLTCRGNITINGTFDYGRVGDEIPNGITATLLLNDSAALAHGKYGLTLNEVGSYYVHGASKTTNTNLTAQALAGATVISIADVAGWVVGDEIVFATTAAGNTSNVQKERRTIQSIVGNTVTITAGLTYKHESLGIVGNITRTVKILPISTAAYSYQNLIHGSNTVVGTREIQHIHAAYLGTSAGGQTHYAGFRFQGASSPPNGIYTSIGNIVSFNVGYYGIDVYNSSTRLTFDNCLGYSEIGHGYMYMRQGSISTFNNMHIYGGFNTAVLTSWSHGGVGVIFNNSFITGIIGFSNSSGQGFIFNNTKFFSCSTAIQLSWGAGAIFNNCDVGYVNGLWNGSSAYCINTSANALTTPVMNNCNFNFVNQLVIKTGLASANTGFIGKMVNMNNDLTQQEFYKSTGFVDRDNGVVHRGVSSIRFNPIQANVSHGYDYPVPATAGAATTVVGYVRFDTAYGVGTPPTVTLSGFGSVAQVFNTPATANVWHKFTLTTTPNTSGALNLNISGTSAATTGNFWLDGVTFAPFVNKVRHYGYVFNESSPSRQANNFVTKTETQAGLITGVLVDAIAKTVTVSLSVTANDIYDYLQYWSAINTAQDAPISTADGSIYTLATGWMLVLQQPITGGINIHGNVTLSTIINLSSTNITGSLTFTAPGTYTITGSLISDVINTSGGTVTINSINSTVTTITGPSITVVNPKSITITVVDSNQNVISNARVFLKSVTTGQLITNSVTDANGVVTLTRNYTVDESIIGYVRKSSVSPIYKQSNITGLFSISGFVQTIQMVLDE